MKTHLICQNSMTGAIHVLHKDSKEWLNLPRRYTECGYRITNYEFQYNPDLTKKSKVCIKCHNSLLRTHNKNLIAHMTYIKLTGEIKINGRFKI